MTQHSYALFQTAIGGCGIAWGRDGIVALQLPASTQSATLARLLRAHPGARLQRPDPARQRVIDDIVALLAGEPRDLRQARLDLSAVPPFHRQVYEVVRAIPPGRTRSYGEVAALCGDRQAARAVGQAMARNPIPIIVPCHRVLAAGGRSGGFSAPGGVTTKLRLLTIEGAIASARTAASGNLAFAF
ncbi:MAG TPA: methylated-DNA--[protein]-cysteine S-methyltransferase [Steroidobacteraceae bacterium]|jgi:methylated-DNA-[protein]-cysteine S-methyltransferase